MKAEVGEVGLGRVERVPVVDPALRVRPAEGHELLGDEPVEIAVLKTGFCKIVTMALQIMQLLLHYIGKA